MAATKDPRIAELEAEGFVVLRAKSYRQAEERRRIVEIRAKWADQDVKSTRSWLSSILTEERRLRDRCGFLYGVARAHGATDAELKGEQ